VPADSGDELAHRFAARAGAVDDQDGFEGFELLRPNDERTTWLVITRWRDEEAFRAWVAAQIAAHQARTNGTPIVPIFDGFDEVDPFSRKQVIVLLRKLRSEPQRFVITSRTSEASDLMSSIEEMAVIEIQSVGRRDLADYIRANLREDGVRPWRRVLRELNGRRSELANALNNPAIITPVLPPYLRGQADPLSRRRGLVELVGQMPPQSPRRTC
jgi:heme-degrading monooxygenase HmoA